MWAVASLRAGGRGAKVPHCKDPNHAKVTALLHIIITSPSFPPRLAPSLSGRSSCKQKVMEEQEEDSCHYVATVNFCYGLRLLNTQKLPQQLLQPSRQEVTSWGTGVVAVRPQVATYGRSGYEVHHTLQLSIIEYTKKVSVFFSLPFLRKSVKQLKVK